MNREKTICVVVFLFGAVLSQSAAAIGLAIAAFFFLFCLEKKSTVRGLIVLSCLALMLAMIAPSIFDGVGHSVEHRKYFISQGMRVWNTSSPVLKAFGVGAYGVSQLNKSESEIATSAATKKITPARSNLHNDYVQLLVEHGVVGMIVMVVFVISFMVPLFLRRASGVVPALVAVGCMCASALVDKPFRIPVLAILAVAVVAFSGRDQSKDSI